MGLQLCLCVCVCYESCMCVRPSVHAVRSAANAACATCRTANLGMCIEAVMRSTISCSSRAQTVLSALIHAASTPHVLLSPCPKTHTHTHRPACS